MDTPESPKDAPKDAPQEAPKAAAGDAPKEAGKDPVAAAGKLAMDSALAAKRMATEFRDFLLKSNMLALALAVVLGNAVSAVVTSIVGDLIMPLAGTLQHNGQWRAIVWGWGRLNFTVGHLAGALLDFALIAGIVLAITKAFSRGAPPPPTKQCKMCLEAIHPDARRCKFCTSEA